MTGQGRRSFPALRAAQLLCAKWWGVAFAAALTLGTGGASLLLGQENVTAEPIRLRLSWGGDEPTRWVGQIRLDVGSFSDLKLLGLAADAAGSIWIENNTLNVASLSPRRADEIEVSATASPNTTLTVDFSAGGRDAPAPVRFTLADVQAKPVHVQLAPRGSTLTVEHIREPLRILPERTPLIFSPGEQLAFELRPELKDLEPGTTLDIRTTLARAQTGETLWTNDQRLALPVQGGATANVNVPLPRAEGAYTIRVTASRPSGFRVGFFPTGPAPLAERMFDLAVIDPAPRTGGSTLPFGAGLADGWETVLELDPTSAHWWERLSTWTQLHRIPGISRAPLGSIRAGTADLPLGRFVELPPAPAGGEPHWQAYSLPLEASGAPHLLEISYPAKEEQHFGVSILEPNAAGVVEGIGRETGVYVEGFGRTELGEQLTHRVLFWPRTQAPLLVMTNAHGSAAAHFGQVRVRRRKADLTAGVASATPGAAERLVAAYISRPLLPESLSASAGAAPHRGANGRPQLVDGWQTFYEAGTRLADYLQYAGYNSAVVCVAADGSSIYPSPLLMPTPLYCKGRRTPEPAERDGLELLLRVFDRSGLALIPALHFATPLPQLEKLRRGSDPQTSGLEWIGPDGRSWLATHGARDGLAPYYNLLDPRVQEALLRVIGELVERYGRHPSFSGVAIQLSANGYSQLPPLDWGLDDATFDRFVRDTGIQVTAVGPERFAARHVALTGEHAAAWRSWRTARVAEFYVRLVELIRESRSDRRLLLTCEESFDSTRLAGRVRPALLTENRVEAMLLDLGIHRDWLENIPGLVWCPTRYLQSASPLADCAITMEINESTNGWHRKGKAEMRATLLHHRSKQRPLHALAAKSTPFKIHSEATLLSQPLPHVQAVRRPYVEALLDNDPALLLEGGRLLPIGQDDELRSVRMILGQLPTKAEVQEVASQPVYVRSYSDAARTTILVVNASPWPTRARISLELPAAATLEPLGVRQSGENPTRPLAAGTQPWQLALEPYSVEAVRVATTGIKVLDVQTDPAEGARLEITARLKELENRDLTAPRAYRGLSNPSFEPAGGGALPGWRLIAPAGAATAELDATSPQHGKTCLYVESGGAGAAVESDAFPMPTSGQMALSFYVRGQNISPQTSVRLVLQTDEGPAQYRRVAPIEPLDEKWRPSAYAIWVNDLPLESAAQMHVRFEISGPGELWFDNVTTYDLLFPLKWYPNSRAEVVQLLQIVHGAKSAFDAGRITDCIRLLDSYWPRFIATHTPLVQPAVAVQPANPAQPKLPPPTEQDQQPAPGVSDRLKRIVPFLR